MPIPFLSLREQHRGMEAALHEAARRVIDSGVYINGPETAAFASELAAVLGGDGMRVTPVSNGLDAIRLILRGYIELGRLKAGDEVILPANTYIASLLPVVEFGLTPVLAKADLSTYGLDWREAERLVGQKTRAVMSVHLYGTPSWDFDVAARMRERGILLLEDNAQAIGARILAPDGRYVTTGALGDAAAFSFYPTKNVGALGDAGAVATNDGALADTVKALANYGSTVRYHNDHTGYNCRMDELQGAFLRVKLKDLDDVSKARASRARLYDSLIRNPGVTRPEILEDRFQVWHQYVVRTPRRDEIRRHLEEAGVATDVHYPLALFDQLCFRAPESTLEDRGGAKAQARRLAAEVLSLPIANVSDGEIEAIAAAVNEA